MKKISPGLEKTLSFMIYGSLMVLAIGLVTSVSLLSFSHILMLVPALYFIGKADYKSFTKSSWAFLALSIVIIISVVANQDIAIRGYTPALKAKYFLFGFLSIAPLNWYFKNFYSEKKVKWLLNAFCIATTVATISGLIAFFTGFNPLLFKTIQQVRNSGLFGMIMNYAHNSAFFLIIIMGLFVYRNKLKQYISVRMLVIALVVNFVGLYFSYTRGAWLALIAGFPFYFLLDNKKLFFQVMIGLCLAGVVVYFVAGSNVIRPQSERERISQWKAAIKATEERPVLGYGYLNFEPHSGEIKKRYDIGSENFVSHAHNNFLEILATTGIIGFICYVAWLFFWFIEMYKRKDLIAKISLPFIVVFVVGGLTQSTISLGVNLFFIFAVYSIGQIQFTKKAEL